MPMSSKEKSQRWRDRKRANPTEHAAYLESERKRYENRIKTGSRKLIGDLSERSKRLRRKVWRSQQSKSRQRKVVNIESSQGSANPVTPVLLPDPVRSMIDSDTTSTTAAVTAIGISVTPSIAKSSGSKRRGRCMVRKDRSKAYRTIASLKEKLTRQIRLNAKYRMALHRQQLKRNQRNTPKSKMERDIAGCSVTSKVKRTLVFHNALMMELRANHVQKKHSLCQVISGKVLKKYRVLTMVNQFGCNPQLIERHQRRRQNSFKRWHANAIHSDLVKKVHEFYLREDNSRCTSGKKETITRHKEKKQIYYINDTVKNLHNKFLTDYTGCRLSYISFSRLRPFWVKQQTVAQRDTCLCRTCDNLQLMANKLYAEGITTSVGLRALVKLVTCDTNSASCMMNECESCQSGLVSANIGVLNCSDQDVDIAKPVSWGEWKTETEIRRRRGIHADGELSVKITKKVQVDGNIGDLCDRFQEFLRDKAKRHFYTIDHQYRVLREMKTKLGPNELCMHIDFAENYSCKFSSEVQSIHFGASRNQVTMHNVVAYTSSETLCFSTLSDSTRHDPSAIWSYLEPILNQLHDRFPQVDSIHFISDSPATQYRSKNNFYFFCTLLYQLWKSEIRMATWNYLEAGHGKGAPDGIGGLLKRTADRLVGLGNDLSNAGEVFAALTSAQSGIELVFVPQDKVHAFDDMLPADLKTIQGTMKIRQLLTTKRAEIKYRSLSCFCSPNKYVACMCHKLSSYVFTEFSPMADVVSSRTDSDPRYLCFPQSDALSVASPHQYQLVEPTAVNPEPEIIFSTTSDLTEVTKQPAAMEECFTETVEGHSDRANCDPLENDATMVNQVRQAMFQEQPVLLQVQDDANNNCTNPGRVANVYVLPLLLPEKDTEIGACDDSNHTATGSIEIHTTSFYGTRASLRKRAYNEPQTASTRDDSAVSSNKKVTKSRRRRR